MVPCAKFVATCTAGKDQTTVTVFAEATGKDVATVVHGNAGRIEGDFLDNLTHRDRVDSQWVFVAVGSGHDFVAMTVDGITRHKRSQYLCYWSSYPGVVELHNAIPAACNHNIGVFGQELRAEDSISVPHQL